MAYDGMYGDLSTRGTTNEILTQVIMIRDEVEATEANVAVLEANTVNNAALAQGAADTALLNADIAASSASNANNSAVAADNSRILAQQAAEDALDNSAAALIVAQDAEDKADAAVATANAAAATANGIDGKAQLALDKSTAADANASNALSVATGVDAKAQTALDNSIAANNTANSALSQVNGKQNVDPTLTQLSTFDGAVDTIPYWSNATTVQSASFTAYGRSLVAQANSTGARGILGLGAVATDNIVPLTRGGTGRSDGRSLWNEVGVNTSPALFSNQGMYMGWNANVTGEGNFIVNRGSGAGGFSWRSVNSTNTITGPTMTYSFDGLLTVTGISSTTLALGTPLPITSGGTGASTAAGARNNMSLGTGQTATFAGLELINTTPFIDFHYNNTVADFDVRLINDTGGTLNLLGKFESQGTWCKAGIAAGRGGTVFNYNWTGSALDTWIDNTYVGSVTLFTSDYRIKKEIVNAEVPSYLDRIDAYRIVNFSKKDFGAVFKADDTVFQGLIAHEVKAVNPLAASGEKDGLDAHGNPLIQQLDPIALITDLMGAVKELRAEVNALKAQLGGS